MVTGSESSVSRVAGGSGLQFEQIGASTHDVIANDEHAIALLETTTRRKTDGALLTYRTVEIYHMRDGKISARWAFSDDTDAINQFFGS